LSDGKVLSAGLSTSAEVYDPATDTWTLVSNDLEPAASGVNVFNLLGDGRVLISGTNKTTVAYNPSTNSFEDVPDMPERLNQPGAVSTANGNVLVFGISSSTDPSDTKTIQVFNATQNQWFSSPFSLNGPGRTTLHQLDNGDILSVGGVAPLGGLAADCYLINENASALSVAGSLSQAPIRLFPNPTRDLLNLEWETAQPGHIQLLDLQGRILLQATVSAGQAQISIGHLPQGIYVYQLHNSTGQRWQGRVEKY
ncbi:MAG: T9SS type A sorting domain-containing protein, partial [Bacteroidota bacterium]